MILVDWHRRQDLTLATLQDQKPKKEDAEAIPTSEKEPERKAKGRNANKFVVIIKTEILLFLARVSVLVTSVMSIPESNLHNLSMSFLPLLFSRHVF